MWLGLTICRTPSLLCSKISSGIPLTLSTGRGRYLPTEVWRSEHVAYRTRGRGRREYNRPVEH
jgi:hypothetical protein